jgi:hypothetical protein
MTSQFDNPRWDNVVEVWVRDFLRTMDNAVALGRGEPGDESGLAPKGVKIIFDGYGLDERTDENDDKNSLSFAVFVHMNSTNGDFPPHDLHPLGLVHRPNEECCILAWHSVDVDSIEVLDFSDTDGTNLDYDVVTRLIMQIDKQNNLT